MGDVQPWGLLSREKFKDLMAARNFGPRMGMALRLVLTEGFSYRMAAEAVGLSGHRDVVRAAQSLSP